MSTANFSNAQFGVSVKTIGNHPPLGPSSREYFIYLTFFTFGNMVFDFIPHAQPAIFELYTLERSRSVWCPPRGALWCSRIFFRAMARRGRFRLCCNCLHSEHWFARRRYTLAASDWPPRAPRPPLGSSTLCGCSYPLSRCRCGYVCLLVARCCSFSLSFRRSVLCGRSSSLRRCFRLVCSLAVVWWYIFC